MKKFLQKVLTKAQADSNGDLLFREEEDKLIIQGTHVMYILDPVGKEIYHCVDGQNTVKDIMDHMTKKFNGDKKMIHVDTQNYIKDMLKKELIKIK